ncbi:bile acid:sodium symporter [Salinisphaera sp. USBA-960]|nr:bile acid:sodium symporter [Salifodinibacter halophilus]NNC26347.1 bile acid:sodium symporter [Salifodinibacter halophilus]
MKLFRWLPDRFVLALIGAIVLASFLPVRGAFASVFDVVTLAAIAFLFFLHGARLSREAVVAGMWNVRLHTVVLATTFVLFPLLALVAQPLLNGLLTPALAAGVLYLALVPSTVQSSIAFTSIAGGNVPAAVCTASLSNMLGVLVTPLLAGVLITGATTSSGISLAALGHIAVEILLPFVLGQCARPAVGRLIEGYPRIVRFVDQGAIVLVVYGAFSASVVAGLWVETPLASLVVLAAVDIILLAIVLLATWALGRALFGRGDAIVLLFCGSKKTLAGGIPIANVLFASSRLGSIILPLIMFHQIQLLVCVWIARSLSARAPASEQR